MRSEQKPSTKGKPNRARKPASAEKAPQSGTTTKSTKPTAAVAAPARKVPPVSTGRLDMELAAVAQKWGHVDVLAGASPLNATRVIVAHVLRILVVLIDNWNNERGAKIRRAFAWLSTFQAGDIMPLGNVLLLEGAPAVDARELRGFWPKGDSPVAEDIIEAASAALLVALDAKAYMSLRRRALADTQDMARALRKIIVATSDVSVHPPHLRDEAIAVLNRRERRRREIERRLGDAALEVFRPGHLTSVHFPNTPAEYAADAASTDLTFWGSPRRARMTDLLARLAADDGADRDRPLLEAILQQGAREAHAWAGALAKDALGPVLGAISRRFTAAAELARRERERPIVVSMVKDKVMYGSERWTNGSRMCSVEWTPDPKVMGERVEAALRFAFHVSTETAAEAAE